MTDCSKREVSKQIAIDWVEENNLLGYYEVSAKAGTNLENLFEDSVCDVMNSNNLSVNLETHSSGITFHSPDSIHNSHHSKIVIRNDNKKRPKQKCCHNI